MTIQTKDNFKSFEEKIFKIHSANIKKEGKLTKLDNLRTTRIIINKVNFYKAAPGLSPCYYVFVANWVVRHWHRLARMEILSKHETGGIR